MKIDAPLLERAIEIVRTVPGDDLSADMAALQALIPSDRGLRHDIAWAAREEIYRRRTPCWVYFATVPSLDLLKIGRSTKVPDRIAFLTRQHGETHVLIGTIKGDYKEEWFAQRRFKRHRVKGIRYREYFHFAPIAADVATLIDSGTIPYTVSP